MGHLMSPGGRWLIIDAATTLYGLADAGTGLCRDEHRRWRWPRHGIHTSVAHCGALSAVVLSAGPQVGVDLQDERDRPGAMTWLGALLGHPEGCPASIRDFAECEALIKVSSLTKETFAGVRLPAWRPGWRRTDLPYRLLSTTIAGGVQLAVAAGGAPEVRWWRARDGEPPSVIP
jgi:hypothetical protein